MWAAKKQKIDDDGRVFNSEWCTKYFVVPHNQGNQGVPVPMSHISASFVKILLQSSKSIMLNVISQLTLLPV